MIEREDMMHGVRPMRSTRRLQNLTTALPRWWSISNKKADGPTLVSIFDEIGFYGVSAGDFLAELAEIKGDLDVHISSPGGDVFDAIAIYNSLKARKGIVAVTVDGIAASAASFIAQAASPGHLEMAPFSTMMIHDGFAAGIGNAADMRALADQLDAASDNIAGIYAERTGKPAEYWRAKMRATTWYKDQEAVDDGLADRVRGKGSPQDSWDLSVYNAARKPDDAEPSEDNKDPDGDGDDDTTAEGDTDHDYVDENGQPVKPPKPKGKKRSAKAKSRQRIGNADGVDTSAWDAAKAWHNGAASDDPAAFYKAICAGRKEGDPANQESWALPYRYTPTSQPNAAAVRNALGRISQTEGLTNREQAQALLERLMKKINPDYEASNELPAWIRNTIDQTRPAWF